MDQNKFFRTQKIYSWYRNIHHLIFFFPWQKAGNTVNIGLYTLSTMTYYNCSINEIQSFLKTYLEQLMILWLARNTTPQYSSDTHYLLPHNHCKKTTLPQVNLNCSRFWYEQECVRICISTLWYRYRYEIWLSVWVWLKIQVSAFVLVLLEFRYFHW